MKLLVVGLLAGCGRFGFDEVPPDGELPKGELPVVRPCGLPETAPPMLTIAGTTFEYTSFTNASQPVTGVRVTALDAETAELLASTTSAANSGSYSVAVATAEARPRRVAMRYERTGFFTTTAVPDLALAGDTLGDGVPLWSFGDAPVWSNLAMMMVYTAGGVPRDVNAGTLNIAVRDCAGASVEDVVVAIDPPSGTLLYQSMDGTPSATQGRTVGPFGHVLVLNAVAGPTRVIATTADGRPFLDTVVNVEGGTHVTLATVRLAD